MIKDKNGNRVNFIRKLNHASGGVNYYDYTTQIKKQDESVVWAAPACVCLPMANSTISNYITCKVTKMSEPKPQRIDKSLNDSIGAGEYIYCGETITMDCTNSSYKEDYCSSYLFDGDSNLVNGFMSVPKLPKDFSFGLTAGYTNIADSSKYYNNNTNIVEDGGGNPRELKLSASDFEGAIWFSSGTRPAFTGSGGSYKLSWSIYPTTDSKTIHTWKNVEDLYDGGTFELTNIETTVSGSSYPKKYTGTVTAKRTQTGGGSNPPYTFSLTLTSIQPIAARTGSGNEIGITISPKSTASVLTQNDLACVMSDLRFNSNYGIGSSVFGEDWYIDFTRIYTSDADSNWSLEMDLVGDNYRLYSYTIDPIKMEWTETNTGTVSIPLNKQGVNTTPGTSYQGMLHMVYGYEHSSGTTASEEEFNKIWNHLKSSDPSFTLYYNFTFDTEHGLFTKTLALRVPKNKINLYESA